MLTSLLIVLAAVSAAAAFLHLVTRASPAHSRKESNDFTGAVVAVIGTTYAVLLAFMLSGVWNMFQQAQVNAQQEANDLVNVYRISSQLSEPAGKTIEELGRAYAQQAVDTEFPSLANNTETHHGGELITKMWATLRTMPPATGNQSEALAELMTTLRSLTEHRRIRIMQSHEQLPGILWVVLIAGGIITVAASCFFGVPSFRFHLLQVIVLSFLISLVLVAIADIDRPYQGDVKVSPEGFEFALHTFNNGEQ